MAASPDSRAQVTAGRERRTLFTNGQQGVTMSAPREKTFLLARPEGRALDWIARRLPARVLPDHLTLLGVAAAFGIAAAYVLSNRDPAWLWAASALLVVHWLGDSLDGTLARVRRIERPAYGYYLDHLVDAVATAVIGIGLGLSPHLLLATGMVLVIAYLVLSINTLLEKLALGVFRLGYGRLGPTEARLGLVAVNTALALGVPLGFQLGGLGMSAFDALVLGAAAIMALGLALRATATLRTLAEREPAGRVAQGSSLSTSTSNAAATRSISCPWTLHQ
jgi:phosphatidylglycerophosphate synthase